MSCNVGETSEGLANEALLILQPFQRRFTYVTGTSRTSPIEQPMIIAGLLSKSNYSLLGGLGAVAKTISYDGASGFVNRHPCLPQTL